MNKYKFLQMFLLLSGIFQIGFWGITHIISPKAYLAAVGMADTTPDLTLLLMHEIGIQVLGIGSASILAARNPIKNFSIIIMLYIIAIGNIVMSLWNMLIAHMKVGQLNLIVIISIQLIILTILFPWKSIQLNNKRIID